MTTPGWEGILDPDEEIIWQGRPDGKIVLRAGSWFGLMFGLLFAGIALAWMIAAAAAGGFFWMFGLLHFIIGLSVAFGAVYLDAYRRRNSWYTLTNRRAFIALRLPVFGKHLRSYPIGADTILELKGEHPASVIFSHETRLSKGGTTSVAVGFHRLADAKSVYSKFREVQRNTQ